ncbi:hypothetical protein ACH40F_39905 [Streptomyces sp. NPDC020794]|uniref:hypothetical protein n=1 Tax=unclassified Streptomyces TaxID=2593676 RepID=UPI0036EB685C
MQVLIELCQQRFGLEQGELVEFRLPDFDRTEQDLGVNSRFLQRRTVQWFTAFGRQLLQSGILQLQVGQAPPEIPLLFGTAACRGHGYDKGMRLEFLPPARARHRLVGAVDILSDLCVGPELTVHQCPKVTREDSQMRIEARPPPRGPTQAFVDRPGRSISPRTTLLKIPDQRFWPLAYAWKKPGYEPGLRRLQPNYAPGQREPSLKGRTT